jgi:Pentapeptide repeats (8 copies)
VAGWTLTESRTRLDVQAAITVIKVLNPAWYRQRVNLSGADLSGADLSSADLHAADLNGADLRGANLRGANLDATNLGAANFRNANLDGALWPTNVPIPDGWIRDSTARLSRRVPAEADDADN